VQAVDLALQAVQPHFALFDRLGHGLQIGLRVGQQLGVLLQAQARSLLLELQVGDALAQRFELALKRHAALVTGAQLGSQVVVVAAFGPQFLLPGHLEVQRVLQATLCGGIRQAREFVMGTIRLGGNALDLLRRCVQRALQFGLAGLQAAL